jgi:prepilin-type N-terminal cleavage/methylation domain-containing protein
MRFSMRSTPLLNRCRQTVALCGGFTLIEVMVAVALAAMLILIAVSAFRAITSTVRTVNRLSVENGLLRQGFQVLLEDADFRHSEANPEGPYFKTWAQRSTITEGFKYRRPYQKMALSKRLDQAPLYGVAAPSGVLTGSPTTDQIFVLPNPNVLIHDPRSWYREQGFWQNKNGVGWSEKYGTIDPPLPMLTRDHFSIHGLYQHIAATDMRTATSLPAAKADGTPYLATNPVPGGFQPQLVNSYNPALRISAFNLLSYIGTYVYGGPGAPFVIWDQEGHLPNWFGTTLTKSHPLAIGDVGTDVAYNYLQFDGASSDNMERWTRNRMLWTQWLGTASGGSGNIPLLIKPVSEDVSASGGAGQAGQSGYDYVMAVRPFPWDTYKQATLNVNFGSWDQAPNYTSSTVRFPWNQADAETLTRVQADRPTEMETWPLQLPLRLTEVPAGMPIMRTSIIRLNAYLGTTLTYGKVSVVSPETGQVLELSFSTPGTDYRGARQHWGLASNGNFGDVYVP